MVGKFNHSYNKDNIMGFKSQVIKNFLHIDANIPKRDIITTITKSIKILLGTVSGDEARTVIP